MSQETNQTMQKEVSPLVLIGVGVAVVALLIFIAARVLAPHPAEVTIPTGVLGSEGAAKRRNIEMAKQKAAGQPVAAPSQARQATDRTGD